MCPDISGTRSMSDCQLGFNESELNERLENCDIEFPKSRTWVSIFTSALFLIFDQVLLCYQLTRSPCLPGEVLQANEKLWSVKLFESHYLLQRR